MRGRDTDSLSQLYRLTYDDLINFGLYFGHTADEAKDAINQLYAELWERADSLPAVGNVRSYLITGLRRKLLREYEHERRFVELSDQSQPLAELSYEEIIVRAQQEEHVRQRLRQALDALTPRQRELIRMRFFENMSNEEIAAATGMHINTVYNTLSLALKGLRQTLNQEEYFTLLSAWPLLLLLLDL